MADAAAAMDTIEVIKLVYNGTMAGAVIVTVVLFLRHLKSREDAQIKADEARETQHQTQLTSLANAHKDIMSLVANANTASATTIKEQLEDQCDRITTLTQTVPQTCKAKT